MRNSEKNSFKLTRHCFTGVTKMLWLHCSNISHKCHANGLKSIQLLFRS
jgi:hypothetical protein